MNFQLVIQFHPSGSVDFDELVRIEDAITIQLGESAFVDGHDIGVQESNVFILTDNPVGSFQRIQRLLQEIKPDGIMNVGYRDLGEDHYVVLWPPNLAEFKVA